MATRLIFTILLIFIASGCDQQGAAEEQLYPATCADDPLVCDVIAIADALSMAYLADDQEYLRAIYPSVMSPELEDYLFDWGLSDANCRSVSVAEFFILCTELEIEIRVRTVERGDTYRLYFSQGNTDYIRDCDISIDEGELCEALTTLIHFIDGQWTMLDPFDFSKNRD